ncbi:MAG: hypothetical protein M1835_006773 [Candelina submexicana]|nr:MAG: hypothetical protein M1835_006773 [Candelina submexicana]
MSDASDPDHTDSCFPFLRLPPELRNRIYHYALDYNKIIIRDRRLFSYPSLPLSSKNLAFYDGNTGLKVPRLGILAANQQLYHESASIFYQNLFIFGCDFDRALDFLESRPRCSQFITRVGLRYSERIEYFDGLHAKEWREIFKCLRRYFRLKELVLKTQSVLWNPQQDPEYLDQLECIRQLIKLADLARRSIYTGYDNSFEADMEDRQADLLEGLLKAKMLRQGGEFVRRRVVTEENYHFKW